MFTFLLILTLGAAAPSPSPSPSPPPEIAHVYTSDRHEETLDNSARTIYTISRAQIERYGYRTVAQALENMPGFEYSPYGAIGSTAQYGIRGNNSAQVLVLIDGLPAPGSFANSVELNTMPTTGVDRIELVEGGGSTLYGTGAIGGIINVITQRKSAEGATLRAGSFGDRSFEIRTPYVQFSRIVARNDFTLPDGSTRPNSDFQSSSLHAGAGTRIGSFDALLRASISGDRGGDPGPTEFISPTSRQADLNEGLNLSLARKTAQALVTLQFGGTRQQITFSCNANTDLNCFQETESLNTEGRFDFGARNVVSGNNEQLLYGIDLARGTVRADDGGGDVSTNSFAQTAAYVQQKFSTRWGGAYAGIRGERDGSLGGEFSPSAGFVVNLSREASLKGNIATAFRAPNASELYFPFFGNPALKPERAKVADLTLVDSNVLGGISLGWFGNRTNNLIVTELIDPVNFVFAPENVGHALIEGLTFQAKTLPFHGFTASLNVTDLYRAENIDTQARLPDDPVLVTNLGLDYAGTGLVQALGISVHSSGSYGPIAYYSRADAYVSLRAAPELLFTLRAFNLGNARYEAVTGFPMPGRTFAFELSTR
jgi:vitamin B12 transporter